MNLREKLSEIDSSLLPKRDPSPRSSGREIDTFLNGVYRETPYGDCFVHQQLYRPDSTDHADIFALRDCPPQLLAYAGKDLRLEAMAADSALFLDTETTGLAGGSGTYVFLTGVGFFTEDGFTVEQYFMRTYSEELAMLHCLRERLDQCSGLISFNGKCYDVPLLKTRFALAKFSTDCFPDQHLDLLFSARRLWRNVFDAFTLSYLETHLLGVRRDGDIPGHLIPHLFFNYLKTQDAGPLQPIFTHNLQDVLSLVLLTKIAGELFSGPPAKHHSAHEYLNVGRVYEDLNMYDKSAALYRRMQRSQGNTHEAAGMRLGHSYKRLGQFERAAEIWREMIARGTTSLHPYVELAKYYEHKKRDYARAMEYVDKALLILEIRELKARRAAEGEDRGALQHRKRRLSRKLLL